jgi:putative glutamine amidotransferase
VSATKPLRIGVSASLVPAGAHPSLALGLPVLVMLESLAHWVMSMGDLAFLIPTAPAAEWNVPCRVPELVNTLDALVLQGGADICPRAYGEEPACPEWSGDPRRDGYELALVQAFLEARKPILGICRGMQLLNVALGGSLYQDIPAQVNTAICHRNDEISPGVRHPVQFVSDSWLSRLYQGQPHHPVVSVHHQCVKLLGEGLSVEAVSPEDAIIEAIRLDSDEQFALGLQWHPEIQPHRDPYFLDPSPILEAFRQAALRRRGEGDQNLLAKG